MSYESFKKEFDILRELGTQVFTLRGSSMIVEILKEEDELKTKSGLYLGVDPNQTRNNAQQNKLQVGRVLMVGEGYFNEDTGTFDPLETQPGSIVLLPQYSVQMISMFPGFNRLTQERLVLIKFDQILGYYASQEAYETAKKALA